MSLLVGCAVERPNVGRARTVTVKARIVAANGALFGGAFGVVGRDSRRVLASGAVDCMGEIEVPCDLPPGETAIICAVISAGMVRNTEDELIRQQRFPNPRSLPLSLKPVGEWKVFDDYDVWLKVSIRSWSDLVGRFGGDHATTTLGEDGGRIDSVARTMELGESDEVVIGDLRFPTAFPALECRIRLVTEAGAPTADPVVLGGFPYRRSGELPERNNFYTQFALAQRGGDVRILATRDGMRALVATGNRTVYLGVAREGGVSVQVSLPEFGDPPYDDMIRLGPVAVTLVPSADEMWSERWERLIELERAKGWPSERNWF